MTETEAKAARNDARATIINNPINTASETEAWLVSIGMPLTNVWLCVKGTLIDERHVLDPTTIQMTVKMSAERLGARSAAYQINGEWEVARYRDLTFLRCPTEEAAKMTALLRG